MVILVCHTWKWGANHELWLIHTSASGRPAVPAIAGPRNLILCFSQKKSDGLKKKSRYRMSSSEHVKRQKLWKCQTLATSPSFEHFPAKCICNGIIHSQSSVRQGGGGAVCQQSLGTWANPWWGGSSLMWVEQSGGAFSVGVPVPFRPSTNSPPWPRPSPTDLTLLFSVFSSKRGCDAHYLHADTHNAKLFPQVPGKGSDTQPQRQR